MPDKKLNIVRIREKVADIKENLQVLRAYSKQDQEDFIANKEALRSAKYAYIVMIEAASNIANHLCARLINASPDSYAECFVLLGKHELISSRLSTNLSKMAGFRNILVHGYKEIDDSKLYDFLQTNLADLDLYLEELSCVLEKSRSEGETDENKNKNKLLPQQKEAILQTITNELRSNQSILFAFVHGSFIEEELPFHDIDIAVYFDEEAAQNDLVDFCLELSVNLSALAVVPVDVHDLNTSRIGFSYEATSGKLLYTANEELSYDFIENIRMKYYDLKPFWKENLQDLLSSCKR